MAGAFGSEEGHSDDIDMERVVADPDYRRSVISRLRRERLYHRTQRFADDMFEAAGEED
jgi:hypothetical protein